MKVVVFSSEPYDIRFLSEENEKYHYELTFFNEPLSTHTAIMAKGFDAVCAFVNDNLSKETLSKLKEVGIAKIVLRCAGFNQVDIPFAEKQRMRVTNVPKYSPHAVAEHAVGLILSLNRHIPRAYNRVREGNFSINGLLGFDLYGKTIGIIGTGKIGTEMARIMKGFGCTVIGYDQYPNEECRRVIQLKYVGLPELLRESDILSLHCPLTPETKHLINMQTIRQMKKGVMLINTSRGKLIETNDAIQALKEGTIGYLGLDVYEEEEHLFFKDLSTQVLQDDVFARLLMFPNVLITAHQAFFTENALKTISEITFKNLSDLLNNKPCENELTVTKHYHL